MQSPRELVEQGGAHALVPINQKVFVKMLEQQQADRGLTVDAFAKRAKLNPSCLSTYRHAPPQHLCVRTVRRFLHAFGMTPVEAEAAGLFPRAGKSNSVVTRGKCKMTDAEKRLDLFLQGMEMGVADAMATPPVRVIIAETELTIAPTSAAAKPAVVEHLGWQLTIKRFNGATE